MPESATFRTLPPVSGRPARAPRQEYPRQEYRIPNGPDRDRRQARAVAVSERTWPGQLQVRAV